MRASCLALLLAASTAAAVVGAVEPGHSKNSAHGGIGSWVVGAGKAIANGATSAWDRVTKPLAASHGVAHTPYAKAPTHARMNAGDVPTVAKTVAGLGNARNARTSADEGGGEGEQGGEEQGFGWTNDVVTTPIQPTQRCFVNPRWEEGSDVHTGSNVNEGGYVAATQMLVKHGAVVTGSESAGSYTAEATCSVPARYVPVRNKYWVGSDKYHTKLSSCFAPEINTDWLRNVMFTFDVSQNLVNSDPHGSFELLVSFRDPTFFNGDAPGSFALAAWLGKVNDDTAWGRSADAELLYCSATKTYTFVFQFMQNALSTGSRYALALSACGPAAKKAIMFTSNLQETSSQTVILRRLKQGSKGSLTGDPNFMNFHRCNDADGNKIAKPPSISTLKSIADSHVDSKTNFQATQSTVAQSLFGPYMNDCKGYPSGEKVWSGPSKFCAGSPGTCTDCRP